MGCHLHELRDAINDGRVVIQGKAPIADDEGLWLREVVHSSDSAICFDAGDIEDIAEFSIVADLVRLPFRTTWIEFSWVDSAIGKVVLGGLCRSLEDDDSRIHVSVFTRPGRDSHWVLRGHATRHVYEDGTAKLLIYGSTGHVNGYWNYARRFLSALHCVNVTRTEHTPSESLQKARNRRGKAPLFSYWTLNLLIPSATRAESDLGATHSSPRVHLRRGHPRQHAPGKWTWVQPHVVGGRAAAGLVHKEYAGRYQ